jgi:beta-glucosidase-like glycosyl hydrolase
MPSEYLTNLDSLEKKLYQLIIHRLDGEKIGSQNYQEKIFEHIGKGIGGFILFGGKKDEVKHFIHTMQSRSEIPLFIASDIERGVGQQVEGTTSLPCQMAVAAALDKKNAEDGALLEKMLEALSNEAHDVGINMPLIPVLDINQKPDNPIICTRAFSDSPQTVAWFGSQYIKVLERSGLISCAKHFPGHGDTTADSHITLPVINKSYDDLLSIDIMPFKEAIKKGVSSIMVGHLSIPSVDAQASSLSRTIITDILRGKLDFKGIVMTDALNMHALKDMDKVPVTCLNAGIDMLLHPLDVDLTVQQLVSAVKTNELSMELIDDAANRIVNFKKNMKLTERKVLYEEHEKLSSKISEMSVTMIKNTAGLLPLSHSDGNQLIFAGDSKHFGSSPLKQYFINVSKSTDTIDLKDRTAIYAIYTSVAAWVGSSGIDETEKERIKELLKKAKHSIVISFGSPYVLRYFKEADVLIAAYEPTVNAQEAVLKCLKGEIGCKGKLPITLK